MNRALAILLVACGGRIDGDDSVGDAGAPRDGNVTVTDARPPSDAPLSIDASKTCSKATTQLGLDGMGNCKFDFRWTCGGNIFDIAGACNTANGFLATCSMSVAPMTKMVTGPMCSCSNPDALALQGAMLCNFSPPGP